MDPERQQWPCDAYCLQETQLNVASVAAEVYRLTCRVDFDVPGFCLLDLGHELESGAFRRLMVDLKREMALIHQSKTGNTLIYLSASRFDQQQTTRPHLDGGPEECLLMLGYEPSAIDAEITIFDYAKCAFDLGLSPDDFMGRYNPMFKPGNDILQPYATRLGCFSKNNYQIVCVNNSSAPYSPSRTAWQGTLHTATIRAPDRSRSRIVNSTMIAPAPAGTPDKADHR